MIGDVQGNKFSTPSPKQQKHNDNKKAQTPSSQPPSPSSPAPPSAPTTAIATFYPIRPTLLAHLQARLHALIDTDMLSPKLPQLQSLYVEYKRSGEERQSLLGMNNIMGTMSVIVKGILTVTKVVTAFLVIVTFQCGIGLVTPALKVQLKMFRKTKTAQYALFFLDREPK